MTRSRIRPVALASVTGTAVALVLAGTAAAADFAEVQATKDGENTVIKVLAVYGEDYFVPKGGERTEYPEDEDFLPSVGDGFGFTDNLMQGEKKVGTQDGVCTATEVSETSITNDCAATITLAGGTLKLEAEVAFDFTESEDEGDNVDIVGGTGAYAGATGTAFIKTLDDESESIVMTFRAGGAQVSEVPTGGAQTGGVHAGGGNEGALVGLGVTAVLGGAALLGARARVHRRGH